MLSGFKHITPKSISEDPAIINLATTSLLGSADLTANPGGVVALAGGDI